MTDAFELLLASVDMRPALRSLVLPNGKEFSFLSRPVTLAQRAKAQKLAGNDTAIDYALQLLVMMAENENGQKLFNAGHIPRLRNELPAGLAETLMLQLLQEPEPPEGEAVLDMKSNQGAAKQKQSPAS